MMKKVTSVFLVCLLALCLSVSVFADNNISPRYANINQADATLSVSSGTATVRATISGVSKVTKAAAQGTVLCATLGGTGEHRGRFCVLNRCYAVAGTWQSYTTYVRHLH